MWWPLYMHSIKHPDFSHDFLCLLFLSVLSSAESEMVVVEVERMLRLAEQCLERAKSFIGKSADPPDLSASIPSSSSCSSGQSEPLQTVVLPAATAANTGE